MGLLATLGWFCVVSLALNQAFHSFLNAFAKSFDASTLFLNGNTDAT
jgi:hypothetical protein